MQTYQTPSLARCPVVLFSASLQHRRGQVGGALFLGAAFSGGGGEGLCFFLGALSSFFTFFAFTGDGEEGSEEASAEELAGELASLRGRVVAGLCRI